MQELHSACTITNGYDLFYVFMLIEIRLTDVESEAIISHFNAQNMHIVSSVKLMLKNSIRYGHCKYL